VRGARGLKLFLREVPIEGLAGRVPRERCAWVETSSTSAVADLCPVAYLVRGARGLKPATISHIASSASLSRTS